jgi:hypothetical protein
MEQRGHGQHPLRPCSWPDVPSQHSQNLIATIDPYQAWGPSGERVFIFSLEMTSHGAYIEHVSEIDSTQSSIQPDDFTSCQDFGLQITDAPKAPSILTAPARTSLPPSSNNTELTLPVSFLEIDSGFVQRKMTYAHNLSHTSPYNTQQSIQKGVGLALKYLAKPVQLCRLRRGVTLYRKVNIAGSPWNNGSRRRCWRCWRCWGSPRGHTTHPLSLLPFNCLPFIPRPAPPPSKSWFPSTYVTIPRTPDRALLAILQSITTPRLERSVCDTCDNNNLFKLITSLRGEETTP